MKVFQRESGMDTLQLFYYPGMTSIVIKNGWNDSEEEFNISMSDWRAMNKALEAAHNGGQNDHKER